MSAGLLWPVVMRKSEGHCQSCVFNVQCPSPMLPLYQSSPSKLILPDCLQSFSELSRDLIPDSFPILPVADSCLSDYLACRPAPAGLSAPLSPAPDPPACLPVADLYVSDYPACRRVPVGWSAYPFPIPGPSICPPVADLCLPTTLCLSILSPNKALYLSCASRLSVHLGSAKRPHYTG